MLIVRLQEKQFEIMVKRLKMKGWKCLESWKTHSYTHTHIFKGKITLVDDLVILLEADIVFAWKILMLNKREYMLNICLFSD